MVANSLDEDQLQAVEAVDGAVVIIAGPGSGKTRTLVHRMQYLCQQRQVAPEHILAITFTTKAAQEIIERVDSILDVSPQVCTLHSLAYHWLQECQVDIPLTQFTQSGEIDFDQLLRDFYDLLALQPQIAQQYQYIMVDEAQDMSATQFSIVYRLAAGHHNICLIGDPDQAIYGFRGADVDGMLQFSRQYPTAQHITLTRNYRCAGTIATAAQQLIQQNTIRKKIVSVPMRNVTGLVQLTTAYQAQQEARSIIHKIEQLIGGSSHLQLDTQAVTATDVQTEYQFSDIAVLYRLNVVGDILEKYFHTSGLPYQRVGEMHFFDRKEIKHVIQLLREYHVNDHPAETIKRIIQQHGLEQQFNERQFDRVQQLVNIASRYSTIFELLEQAELTQDEDYWNIRKQAITLSTIHAAKGLEYPVVFIAGVEEEILPHMYSEDDTVSHKHLEEERRLLYVAITRAQDRLYVSHAGSRIVYGEKRTLAQSRFIAELPQDIIQTEILQPPQRRKNADQMKLL